MASDSNVNFSDSRGSKTLVLNMIVKNEERILPRLFDSVIHLIDTYCICDTGSTDNTIQVITEYMMHAGKQGEVYKEPFQNFGYNRTHALERASHWGTYALLLDADMILHYDPAFSLKSSLTAAGYAIKQIQGALTYYNPRLVKTGIGVRCVGPTHEYYDFPSGHACEEKPDWLSGFWIQDLGDGGCKSDKFERDIRLLQKGLEENPNNDRYTFYLANSLRDAGRTKEAIEMFQKR
ncbi:MAG: glycosyltransferase, partial [Flavobacteriia bacterium]|nr:glycosyltransferase [Flavobacteriia bacterium]